LVAHFVVACLFIGIIFAIQSLLIVFGDPKLLDAVPLRYIFDGMDGGILVAFVILGTLDAVRVFRINDDD